MKYLLLLAIVCFCRCSKDSGISCPAGVEFQCGCYPNPDAPPAYKPAFKNGSSCFYTDDNGNDQKIDNKYCLCR